MKMTVELTDELIEQTRYADGRGTGEHWDESLRHPVQPRERPSRQATTFPAHYAAGLTETFDNGGWERLRNDIYRDLGA